MGPSEITAPAEGARSLPRGTETVLVVEDEPTILELSRRQLSALGYRVLTAGSPQQALDLARLYPDYEALIDDGRFEALAVSVCGPLAEWAREQVQVRIHPEAGNPAHATGDAA